jgi:alpha-tubulin suppressor-like RCC1 family protein
MGCLQSRQLGTPASYCSLRIPPSVDVSASASIIAIMIATFFAQAICIDVPSPECESNNQGDQNTSQRLYLDMLLVACTGIIAGASLSAVVRLFGMIFTQFTGICSRYQIRTGNSCTAFLLLLLCPVTTVATASTITAGSRFTCVLTTASAGGVRWWGLNSGGQLGDGTSITRTYPPTSDLLTSVAAIAAGEGHTCALTTSGGVRCWGHNSVGQVIPEVFSLRGVRMLSCEILPS